MIAHTPGPWVVSNDGCGIESDGEHIAVCNAIAARENRKPGETMGVPGSIHPKNYANARLIAAAPELLAALEEITDAHESLLSAYLAETGKNGYGWGVIPVNTARAAIAIAKGPK